MTYLAAFFRFWYNFIIGDDWIVAAMVAVGLALTFWLAHSGNNLWWLMPLVAILTLVVALWRSIRH